MAVVLDALAAIESNGLSVEGILTHAPNIRAVDELKARWGT